MTKIPYTKLPFCCSSDNGLLITSTRNTGHSVGRWFGAPQNQRNNASWVTHVEFNQFSVIHTFYVLPFFLWKAKSKLWKIKKFKKHFHLVYSSCRCGDLCAAVKKCDRGNGIWWYPSIGVHFITWSVICWKT